MRWSPLGACVSDAVRELLAIGTTVCSTTTHRPETTSVSLQCCERVHCANIFRTVVIWNIPVGVTFIRYTYVINHTQRNFVIWQLKVFDLLQLSVPLHTVYTVLCIFNVPVRRWRSPISRFLVSVYNHVLVQLAWWLTFDVETWNQTLTDYKERYVWFENNDILFQGWLQQLFIQQEILRLRIYRGPNRDQLLVCGQYASSIYQDYTNIPLRPNLFRSFLHVHVTLEFHSTDCLKRSDYVAMQGQILPASSQPRKLMRISVLIWRIRFRL